MNRKASSIGSAIAKSSEVGAGEKERPQLREAAAFLYRKAAKVIGDRLDSADDDLYSPVPWFRGFVAGRDKGVSFPMGAGFDYRRGCTQRLQQVGNYYGTLKAELVVAFRRADGIRVTDDGELCRLSTVYGFDDPGEECIRLRNEAGGVLIEVKHVLCRS